MKNNETKKKQCNCIKKETCPLNNKCLTENIAYEAKIESDLPNETLKFYIGISEGPFKKRYANHIKSFNHIKYETETELSKQYWKIKKNQGQPKLTWNIKKKCKPYNQNNNICNLCTTEKLMILE